MYFNVSSLTNVKGKKNNMPKTGTITGKKRRRDAAMRIVKRAKTSLRSDVTKLTKALGSGAQKKFWNLDKPITPVFTSATPYVEKMMTMATGSTDITRNGNTGYLQKGVISGVLTWRSAFIADIIPNGIRIIVGFIMHDTGATAANICNNLFGDVAPRTWRLYKSPTNSHDTGKGKKYIIVKDRVFYPKDYSHYYTGAAQASTWQRSPFKLTWSFKNNEVKWTDNTSAIPSSKCPFVLFITDATAGSAYDAGDITHAQYHVRQWFTEHKLA